MPTFCKSDCSNPPCKHIQVRLYVSFRFVQHALPNTCSSSCRHAGFKCMFDLKISLMTQANSLKILQTTEIHRPTLAKPVSKVKSLVSGCPLRNILQGGHWRCTGGLHFGTEWVESLQCASRKALAGTKSRNRVHWRQYSSREGNHKQPWNLDDLNEQPDHSAPWPRVLERAA